MNKKKIIIIILIILILFGIYMLYNTFAINTIASNNTDNEYNIVLEDNNTITIPSNSNKTIYFHIKNTNKGTIKYGVGYNTTATIEVKVYNDSIDKVSDTIDYGENKFIKLYLNNPTNTSSTVTLTSVLGYENGGDLIVPSGISLITEVYTPPKAPTIADYITNLYTTSSKSTVVNNSITYNYAPSVSLMNDRLGGTTTSLDGGNIRYYGASPNNYIYFNCEEYPRTNCELWRIIGVFNGKVKIMRNESVGEYSWDNKGGTTCSNDWAEATLMKMLNAGYESELFAGTRVRGSLYYNSKSGSCYTGSSSSITLCDFTSTGIKNDTTRNLIAEVTWNLGGWNTTSIFSNQIYGYERGTKVTSGNNTTWTGKIALPYSSDYGYAADFNKCSVQLDRYSAIPAGNGCKSTDWMNSVNGLSWILAHNTNHYASVWYKAGGIYSINGYNAYDAQGVVPTLFLSSSAIIESGEGSSTNPYKLTP